MKPLTYSDQIMIEALKATIISLGNDIEDVKKGTAAQNKKIILIFQLSQARADQILKASRLYPHIQWTKFMVNSKVKIDKEIIYEAITNSKNNN